MIVNIRPLVLNTCSSSGLQCTIDLMNEGAPAPSQATLQQYVKRLWGDYVVTFGKDNTLGFSIMEDAGQKRYETLVGILDSTGHGRPYLYDVHFYDDIRTNFQQLHDAMVSKGDKGTGWIIGETYYNSAQVWSDISSSIAATGRNVFWVTQWPLSVSMNCPDVDVVPIKFSYAAAALNKSTVV